MRTFLFPSLVAAMLAVWGVHSSDAQESLTQSDRRGPVSVTVTLMAPPTVGTPLTVRVILDTHSVPLDGVAFDAAVALRVPGGTEVTPTVEQATGSGHHRQAVLAFPPVGAPGTVAIVVKNVGGVAERIFTWELR